ncbi:hypothetical protein A1F94_000168 [Pyrenophora tritici-repentis]|uniref:Uncharacterized protein n=1 Tax=Pyrenophora tritici-repentis TaxID=45151 RepID=A0A2W1DWS5_9PLEO|nr:hypothetical protein A1F99_007810 [Pyrenophora tritici-repentis]KAF7576603.1 hypothetical protein PtrM4_008430 [Pyrenophora tritici-repentis]KAG9387276.1 hypothetical protein A1F94_000168 [Pyrenophora tritici-repentis]KAI0587422.1 hypothetical protein Alg130_03855 [Pyrenophora tritici-repentis]KAI0614120.1 hypothetical protein TUN205_01624 [Pyrenophora tritici-repentis]
MRFSTIIAATILGAANMAYAGHNCKCQDPSGTGPQWDGLTQQVCNEQSASQNLICGTNIIYHPQEHHQVSRLFLFHLSDVETSRLAGIFKGGDAKAVLQ